MLGALKESAEPIEPPPSKLNELSSSKVPSSDETFYCVPAVPLSGVAGCASRTASPKSANAAAATAPIE